MLEALPALFTRHRLARPLALAAQAALVGLLVLTLARVTWFVVALNTPALPAALPHVAPAAKPTTSLATWHLFGNALPQVDPRGVAQPSRETALKLTLRGVFALDDPTAGRAIIADENGAEESYEVGADLPGGAKLAGVYADHVTLSRGSVAESLSLPPPGSGAPNTPPRGASPLTNRAPLPGATASPRASEPFVNPNIVTNPGNWNQATPKLDPNVAALAQNVQALPVMENGKFVGVRLSGGKDAALLGKLGLQPDDVVTQVNGIPLDNPARGAEVAASLQNATNASIVVRRNGKSVPLSVSLH